MKAFVLGFTALLALSACSNMSKKKAPAPGMDSDLLTEWSKPFVYETATKERRPSSDQTSPPRTVWEADTLKIPVTAGAVVDQTYNVKFTQALYYETVVRGTKPEAYDDIAWRTGKY